MFNRLDGLGSPGTTNDGQARRTRVTTNHALAAAGISVKCFCHDGIGHACNRFAEGSRNRFCEASALPSSRGGVDAASIRWREATLAAADGVVRNSSLKQVSRLFRLYGILCSWSDVGTGNDFFIALPRSDHWKHAGIRIDHDFKKSRSIEMDEFL